MPVQFSCCWQLNSSNRAKMHNYCIFFLYFFYLKSIESKQIFLLVLPHFPYTLPIHPVLLKIPTINYKINHNVIKVLYHINTVISHRKWTSSHHSGAAAGCENHRVPPGCLLDMDSPHPYWRSAACWSKICNINEHVCMYKPKRLNEMVSFH